MKRHWHLYLGLGLICTWLAGIGRYWDNPRAEDWQTLGLGSLAYIFVLALVLWLMIGPLGPRNWSYLGVLTFVGLTSPPALFYAIPVERFLTLGTAQLVNMLFLLVVAVWRVALLYLYLTRAAGLSGPAAFVGTFLPLVLIVNALSFLNLEHVVFEIMAGLTPAEETANDASYSVLLVITLLSLVTAPILLLSYFVLCWRSIKQAFEGEGPDDKRDAA